MVVCDTEWTVYDLWYHPASYHEVKLLSIEDVMRIGCLGR